jgi:gluconate 2-dehydrogenase gamma chain
MLAFCFRRRLTDGRARDARSSLALLGRRDFMKALSVLAALAMMPLTPVRRRRRGYLTAHEMATLAALCDCVIPPDHDPGASALGAPRYIDRLLSAFDRPDRPPRIFAGGPFSHRHDGPRNAVKNFLPLTRLEELRWRAELFGSAAVAGAGLNDATLGPLKGLREIYRDGLAKVDDVAIATAGGPFASLSTVDRERIFAQLGGKTFTPDARRGGLTFVDHLVQHTVEACLALPEYGGNRGRNGWRMLGIEGDSAPLGYSVFSPARNDYVERARHPVSTPNPDELAADGTLVPRPLSSDGERVQSSIVRLTRLVTS